MQEKGKIAVHSENIFPIIKRFLYADHDVFLRELVANAVDATQKLKQLATLGEFDGELSNDPIRIIINETLKTITISDHGIGMSAEEVKKYINQVAFSGASEFVEKYKDKGQENPIIGYFGLGFYSAFMVASRVEIITKSYKKDTEAVHWDCDGTTQFEINKTIKKEVGTDVILHISNDEESFLKADTIRGILEKYCKFLPIEIEFEGKIINHTKPLWILPPNELKETDYLTFYKTLYPFGPDPLFWIHLNVDYPFHLTGILYFPQVTKGSVSLDANKIQLYAKQMFITEEVKDIVPSFLMLIHGVIDSPDIPLNVSRSYLQADSNVKKINTYITKKVADKLEELFQKDRTTYETKWSSIELFVKYGMLTDDKFYEKAQHFMLVKNVTNAYFTINEYIAKIREQQTDKNQITVLLYSQDPEKQDFYIQACKEKKYDVLVFNEQLDSHLMAMLERKLQNIAFKRVDAMPMNQLIEKTTTEATTQYLSNEETKKLEEIYKEIITEQAIEWSVAPMSAEDLPVVLSIPEFTQRFHAMSKLQPGAMDNPMPNLIKATINTNHPLAKKILAYDNEVTKRNQIVKEAYMLGQLASNILYGKELTTFIKNNVSHLLEH